MARVVDTANYAEESKQLSIYERDNVYCGIDSSVTSEVFSKLYARADPLAKHTYENETRYSVIAAIMSDRGIRINAEERIRQLFSHKSEYLGLEKYINEIGDAIGVGPINPRSPKQLQDVFYGSLNIKPVLKRERGKLPRPTTDEDALKKISQYFYARPLALACLAERELRGVLKILSSGVDPDGRMRAEFEPGSVETGRWASRKNSLGGGTNFQNITDKMRQIFIPDDGYVLAYSDLEQAESRATAYYADDEAYISACESADLHRSVVQMMWPGSDPYEIYTKHFTRRDIGKRAGHATNYVGNPFGVSAAIGVSKKIIEDFQEDYFTAFPGIKRHHKRIAQILQDEMCLTTVFGRRRHFFSRPWATETLKEAVAHLSQSTVADYLNEGLCAMFEAFDMNEGPIRVLAQVHDAVLYLIRQDSLDLIPEIEDKLSPPVTFPSGKTMRIPVETQVGYNWAHDDLKSENPTNPHGLGKLEDLGNKRLIITPLG